MTATKNRRIVIGDVHGYYEGLMTLLEAIAPNARDSVDINDNANVNAKNGTIATENWQPVMI